MRLVRGIAALLVCAIFSSCDKPAAAPTVDDEPHPLMVTLRTMARLSPNLPTHVATDGVRTYVSQETGAADAGVSMISDDGSLQPTPLSTAGVLKLLDATGGSGNFQSIATGIAGDDGVYFYFSGSDRSHAVAGFGRFSPQTGEIRILADTNRLASATGMGISLNLAAAKIIIAEPNVWLWVHHSDAGCLLRQDAATLRADRPVNFVQPFEKITSDTIPCPLYGPGLDISAGVGGKLLALDLWDGALWSIQPNGYGYIARWLTGATQSISTPGVDQQGQAVLFVGQADLLEPHIPAPRVDALIKGALPQLVFTGDSGHSLLPRSAFDAPAHFLLEEAQIAELVTIPGKNAWLGYDSASGHVLRIDVSPKP